MDEPACAGWLACFDWVLTGFDRVRLSVRAALSSRVSFVSLPVDR
jgi:hypothetical protein